MNLKQKLNTNSNTIGSWITIPNNSIVEIMSVGSFDWLAIDMEHSSITNDQCQNLILAIESKKICPLVRVASNSSDKIKTAMDSGAHGIIVPMINSAKDAKRAVDYAKYAPLGKRGVGLSRAQNYGFEFDKYKLWQENESIIIAQIEHIEAIKNIEEIIFTQGIDGIIIGPYDLSASLGDAGNFNNNEFKNAIKKIETTCKINSFPIGYHVIEPNINEVKTKMKEGYSFIGFSIDFLFLGHKIKEQFKIY